MAASFMITHKTKYRVIYGDTDKMGIAYHANYLRWFEMGRSELFRYIGFSYKEIEEKGVFLPVSEIYCKFLLPARYDDILIIETSIDNSVKGGMKFDYSIFNESGKKILVTGHTKHAFVNSNGKVIRPPEFLSNLIENKDNYSATKI